ncbi:MAG: response regulator [bacterium]
MKLRDLYGLEVLRQIKEIEPHIIVILMSISCSKEIIIRALQLKADDYFDKPIDIKNIKTRIRSLLELKENPYNFREYLITSSTSCT